MWGVGVLSRLVGRQAVVSPHPPSVSHLEPTESGQAGDVLGQRWRSLGPTVSQLGMNSHSLTRAREQEPAVSQAPEVRTQNICKHHISQILKT